MSLLPVNLVQSAMFLHCKPHISSNRFVFSSVRNVLQNMSFTFAPIPHKDLRGRTLSTKGTKMAFIQEVFSLKPNIPEDVLDIYIRSNISSTRNGQLELFVSPHLPSFRFSLPMQYVSLYFPPALLPNCFMPRDTDRSTLTCFNDILINSPLVREEENIHIETYFPSPHVSKEHLILQSQCGSKNCFTQYVSWNEANNLCKRKGMHLPEIHSLQDMHIIRDQFVRHECQQSRVSLSKTLKVKVLYQTIAIFIGLTSKVGLPTMYSMKEIFLWWQIKCFCVF